MHPSVLTHLFDGYPDCDLTCSLGARFRHIKVIIRRFRPVAAASRAYQVSRGVSAMLITKLIASA